MLTSLPPSVSARTGDPNPSSSTTEQPARASLLILHLPRGCPTTPGFGSCKVKMQLLQSPEQGGSRHPIPLVTAPGGQPASAAAPHASGACCSTPNTPHASDANQSSQGHDDNETRTGQCHIRRPEGQVESVRDKKTRKGGDGSEYRGDDGKRQHVTGHQTRGKGRHNEKTNRQERACGHHAEGDRDTDEKVKERVPQGGSLTKHDRHVAVEGDEQELLSERQEHERDRAQHTYQQAQARRRRRDDVASEKMRHLRLTVRVGGNEEDTRRGGKGLGDPDAGFERFSASALERREDHEADERKPERTDEGERTLGCFAMLMGACHALEEEGERDPGG